MDVCVGQYVRMDVCVGHHAVWNSHTLPIECCPGTSQRCVRIRRTPAFDRLTQGRPPRACYVTAASFCPVEETVEGCSPREYTIPSLQLTPFSNYKDIPLDDWTEIHVTHWLKSIRLKEDYISKLYEAEVTGPVLKKITEKYLKRMCMKDGQIELLLISRDELLEQTVLGKSQQERCNSTGGNQKGADIIQKNAAMSPQEVPDQKAEKAKNHDLSKLEPKQSLKTSPFRPFDEIGNFRYVKNQILLPETGIIDLISPCHEYKSLATAVTLDKKQLQTKFTSEVVRFAAACLNVRTNGTIHFGIMDSVEAKGYEHGQIVGIPIQEKELYSDALNNLKECFPEPYEYAVARLCIRPPQFVEVIDKDSDEKLFVVEVDIVPLSCSVKGKKFQVRLPKYNKNKINYGKLTIYERNGTKTEPVKIEEELNAFEQRQREADIRREKAELLASSEMESYEDLGRKLSVLLTNGKQYFDDTQWYVVVSNKCEEQDLEYLKFLKDINILCVFDFDPESDSKGLCSRYKEYHATNIYSLESYSSECVKTKDEIVKNLCLFKQTCWIFCNGRTNFLGDDQPCDEHTWIRNKGRYFKRAVSLICDEIIKRGCFTVLFLLLSSVEKPIVEAFNEFYREMSGLEYITCIVENKDYYEHWSTLAQNSCTREELDQRSIVGMKLSHAAATVQKMLPTTDYHRRLPVFTGGFCILTVPEEERMHSLNILCLNECSNINQEKIDKKETQEFESFFYRGGKISWKHFWLAEQKKCGQIIERHGCTEVEDILNDILNKNTVKLPVARIKIVHHPGSGGSTVVRQILWKNKKHLRCAIVNASYPVTTVCEHTVKLREYEEKDMKQCLPVLLLLEDCEEEYIDDLKHYLGEAMRNNTNNSKPSFILLSCNRSNAPLRLCTNSTHDTVAITHKLNPEEERLFKAKADELSESFSSDLIISFVLMSHGFEKKYLKDFVENAMREIDHSSTETRLLRYVALLNHYVQNSYISLSHCEAFLGLKPYFATELNKLNSCNFLNSLSDQAKLILIELRENTSWISSIRILHPLIAEELLVQLSSNYPQSKIAMDLLQEESLLHHKFGQKDFVTFIRHLFLRRHRKSRGDNVDTIFSPLIEHVCNGEEAVEMAIKLLESAYVRFDKDALFAQQLARLHYKNERFEDAKKWAETAKSHCPHDSFILDTEGQVYKKWFNVNMDKYLKDKNCADVIHVMEMGLKSMECFKAAQKAAKSETDTMNYVGYFSEVDVGCRLLQLLSDLDVFNKEEGKKTELLKYLLTKYIPEDLKTSWAKIHGRLKGLYQNIYDGLEWISEEVGYFQTDKIDGEEARKGEDHIHNPRRWLMRKTKIFARFFKSHLIKGIDGGLLQEKQFVKKMSIYELGGGSATTILSLLSDSTKNEKPKKLETILDLYGPNVSLESLDNIDLINYIMCHIALGSVSTESTKLLPFQKLRDMSKRFLRERAQFPPSAYLIIFMLYWPDDKFDEHHNESVLTNAVKTARHLHELRLKNIPVRKKRTNVLFFLGKGCAYQKFIHRSTIEKMIEEPLNERFFRWDSDPKKNQKNLKIQNLLQKVSGWTENGKVYTKRKNGKEKIEVLSLNYSSVPNGNENVTFYVGFTYIGFVAYNVQVSRFCARRTNKFGAMAMDLQEAGDKKLPLDDWTESDVGDWLHSIRIKKEYIDKLVEEEVSGPVLKEINEEFLKNIGMKQGPIQLPVYIMNAVCSLAPVSSLLLRAGPGSTSVSSQCKSRESRGVIVRLSRDLQCELREELHGPARRRRELAGATDSIYTVLLKKRDELLSGHTPTKSEHGASTNSTTQNNIGKESVLQSGRDSKNKQETVSAHPVGSNTTDQKQEPDSEPGSTCAKTVKPLSLKTEADIDRNAVSNLPMDRKINQSPATIFRPFSKEVGNFRYVKNQVLEPETGIKDLIIPCHEYKSLVTAANLDRVRLQAKFACEVIRFGCACMNTRTNGTIHFGVMDSVEGKGYQHGEIVGIPVSDQDWYVDALDYIEKCFTKESHEAARSCIRPPKFIEVIQKESMEQRFVVEVDIVPQLISVKGKVFQVSLPKFNEKSNKVSQDKRAMYRRVGAKSEIVPEEDSVSFIQGLQHVDLKREQAECKSDSQISAPENLRRKLVLLTGGKEYMDDTLWYILVANKCEQHHLKDLNFLMRVNVFCVFDFDPDSDETGLCSKYKEHHARNIHSLISYSNENGLSRSELQKSLCLFDQTSWIFCNGRNNYRGGDEPCDEDTWIKTKKKYLKKAVSLICNDIFPKGSFIVIFFLMSPVEKPIVDAFHEFYSEMNGIEDIICIAEIKEYYNSWASLAQASCKMQILEQRSIVGIPLRHIDATVQNMFPVANSNRNLPVSSKGVCVLETPAEERMNSLEILCVNECNDKNLDHLTKEEVKELEGTYYRGGKISWKHFWLAEQKKCGEFIERDAFNKVQEMLKGILYENKVQLPVARIKIYHHPGSGGSTIARQVLWKNRRELRCAIVKSSCLFSEVSQHAVKFREYDEVNPNLCLPVLLLIEDCEEDYLDDLRHDLSEAMVCKKITSSKPCFILMSCKRSNAPEDLCKASPQDTVAVTHKLSEKEKLEFSEKAKELEKAFPNSEFILTFVLMSHEFNGHYVTQFVQNVLKGIDHASNVTRLMRYVALLNCYVQNSYISVSHCEAFLGLGVYTKDQHNVLRQYNFKSCLSEQARLLFIELRETTTWLNSIQIIHPLVAKEVLNQLSGRRPQSDIAKDLLEEKVLLQHRFGRDEFIKFIRDLFLRRHRKIRGDNVDSFFSPLIEHVCEVEKDTEKAIKLLEAAYERFDKDPFFAQQLARLNYKHEKFEEAKGWAEIAKSHLPGDSYILDTEGQVYKKWFSV
ncbi:sterile alpha motif domain-containing 9-like [Pelobates cultripes]|uniref:Sterile alpha motif domain-containing 9-like n=1 Tax=Pelobates cultripes TaxID=61616 RepID=A0AAD1S447_PELCU|nr:sterile alpha motif domain-containing 9-like [Pelobates cultripes]